MHAYILCKAVYVTSICCLRTYPQRWTRSYGVASYVRSLGPVPTGHRPPYSKKFYHTVKRLQRKIFNISASRSYSYCMDMDNFSIRRSITEIFSARCSWGSSLWLTVVKVNEICELLMVIIERGRVRWFMKTIRNKKSWYNLNTKMGEILQT
jgi:hypothetical protein